MELGLVQKRLCCVYCYSRESCLDMEFSPSEITQHVFGLVHHSFADGKDVYMKDFV